MTQRIKHYQLSDGKKYTVAEISDKVGAPQHIIHSRLTRTKNVDKVFAEWIPRKNGRKCKAYQMEDTKEWVTCWDVVKRVKCSLATARVRLSTHTTADKVFMPKLDTMDRGIGTSVRDNSYKMRQIKSRGMFDDMFALAMRGI